METNRPKSKPPTGTPNSQYSRKGRRSQTVEPSKPTRRPPSATPANNQKTQELSYFLEQQRTVKKQPSRTALFSPSSKRQQTNKLNSNNNSKQLQSAKRKPPRRPLGDIFKILSPETIRSRIFKRLSINDKRRCRLVTKLWVDLMNPLLIWNLTLSDAKVVQAIQFFRSGKCPQSLTITQLKEFRYPAAGFCPMESSLLHTINFFPPSHTSKLSGGIKASNFEAILKDWNNVKCLQIDSECFRGHYDDKLAFVRTLKLPELTTLVMATTQSNRLGHTICTDLLTTTFPFLTLLSVLVNYEMEKYVQSPPLYVEVYKFAIRHKHTLRSLFLNHSGKVKISTYMLGINDVVSESSFNQVMSSMSELSLLELQLVPSLFEGRGRFLFGIQLINSQNLLTTFKIAHIHRCNINLWHAVTRLFQRAAPTLKYIIVCGCICPSVTGEDTFSCSVLSPMSALQELTLSLCGLKLSEIDQLPKQITSLDLGPDLTMDQINDVIQFMPNVEKLVLFQRNAKFFDYVPKVSRDIFVLVLKSMPVLKRLVLLKGCCQWEIIQGVISRSKGALRAVENSEPDIGKDHIGININRKKLLAGNFLDNIEL